VAGFNPGFFQAWKPMRIIDDCVGLVMLLVSFGLTFGLGSLVGLGAKGEFMMAAGPVAVALGPIWLRGAEGSEKGVGVLPASATTHSAVSSAYSGCPMEPPCSRAAPVAGA
jgi:hypothetical protein